MTRPSEARRSKLARTARGLGVASRILIALQLVVTVAVASRVVVRTDAGVPLWFFAFGHASFLIAFGIAVAIAAGLAGSRRTGVWASVAFLVGLGTLLVTSQILPW